MHYHCEIWIPEYLKIGSEELERKIEDIMSPYYEGAYSEEDFEGENPPITIFDWYSISGRWTGAHDNYNPADDPRNYKTCFLCNGTGDRRHGNEEPWVWYDIDNNRRFKDKWSEQCNGCNVCRGTGIDLVHPSDYVPHEQDVMSVSDISDKLDCYTLIVNSKVFQKEEWNGKDFVKTEFDGYVKKQLMKLGIKTGYLVTVDYHC